MKISCLYSFSGFLIMIFNDYYLAQNSLRNRKIRQSGYLIYENMEPKKSKRTKSRTDTYPNTGITENPSPRWFMPEPA